MRKIRTLYFKQRNANYPYYWNLYKIIDPTFGESKTQHRARMLHGGLPPNVILNRLGWRNDSSVQWDSKQDISAALPVRINASCVYLQPHPRWERVKRAVSRFFTGLFNWFQV